MEHHVPLDSLPRPQQFTFFNGSRDVVTHLARPRAVQIGCHQCSWTFLVVTATPMPIVLGLDAIRGWPLFYSPLDDRLFILPDSFPTNEASPPKTCLHTHTLLQEGREKLFGTRSRASAPALTPSQEPPSRPSPLSALETPATNPDDQGPWDDSSPLTPPHPLRPPTLCQEPTPGDTEVTAENVIDFLNLAMSPWRVEWVGEAEDEGEVRLMTVTASGEEEHQALQTFLASLDPGSRQL